MHLVIETPTDLLCTIECHIHSPFCLYLRQIPLGHDAVGMFIPIGSSHPSSSYELQTKHSTGFPLLGESPTVPFEDAATVDIKHVSYLHVCVYAPLGNRHQIQLLSRAVKLKV